MSVYEASFRLTFSDASLTNNPAQTKLFSACEQIVYDGVHYNLCIVLLFASCWCDVVDSVGEVERGQSSEANLAHHVLVCALHELGCLVQSLGTSSAPLITEPSAG